MTAGILEGLMDSLTRQQAALDALEERLRTVEGQQTTGEPLLLTIGEAARRLSHSRSALYVEMSAGRLPYVTHGKGRLIPTNALEEYVAKLGSKNAN